jgi:hypothetical protein
MLFQLHAAYTEARTGSVSESGDFNNVMNTK